MNTSVGICIGALFLTFLALEVCSVQVSSNDLSDLITSLPSLPFPFKSRHFSGYLSSLNSTYLFYWFVESQSDPQSDPLLLWLSGGPGCSSLFGAFAEVGPILIYPNGTLTSNNFAWNQKANLLFIESPAGVGFSFRTNANKYETDDFETAQINFHALKSFFAKFPQFTGDRKFFLAGQSYASRYIVHLSKAILDSKLFPLNFGGFVIGNGDFDPELDVAFFIPTLKVYRVDDFSWLPMTNYTAKLWKYNLKRSCTAYSKLAFQEIYIPESSIHRRSAGNPNEPCGNEAALTWYFNRPDVLRSIHAHLKSGSSTWKMCAFIRPRNFEYLESEESLAPAIHYLASKGLRILLYNGDSDAVCNYLSMMHFLKHFRKVGERRFFEDRGRVYGTVQIFEKNITFVRFFGSGHSVPIDQPKGTLKMVNELLFNFK